MSLRVRRSGHKFVPRLQYFYRKGRDRRDRAKFFQIQGAVYCPGSQNIASAQKTKAQHVRVCEMNMNPKGSFTL